jgi:pyruvate carboxylase
VFRIFDSLNWLKGMEACIGLCATKPTGWPRPASATPATFSTPTAPNTPSTTTCGWPSSSKTPALTFSASRTWPGLLKPYAATELIAGLRATVQLPIHLHTHDTSSLQAATYAKAVEAGVNVIDVALGALSGLTSQPNFNSVVEMLRHTPRHREFNQASLNEFSNYWEAVREMYYPFESGLKAGTSEVFQHEIPGGSTPTCARRPPRWACSTKFEEVKQRFAT